MQVHGVQNARDSGLDFDYEQDVTYGPIEVIIVDPCFLAEQ